MRILIVSTWIPFPAASGVRIRTLEIARRLARRHEVTFAVAERWEGDRECAAGLAGLGFGVISALGNPQPARLSGAVRNLFRGLPLVNATRASTALEAKIRDAAPGFDVIQVENIDFGNIPLLCAESGRITSLVLHDLLPESYARMAAIEKHWLRSCALRLDGWGFANLQRRAAPRYDIAVTMSDREREILSRTVPMERILTVPNCADLSQPPLPPPENPEPVLLFVGHMNYGPNTDAVQWLTSEIFPRIRQRRPDARLILAGGDLPPGVTAGGGIEARGVVRDIEPLYREAGIVLAPLRAGGGTRLKILEAMAKGRPVVATPLGAEGLGAVNGTHILMADTAAGLADAVMRLVLDGDERRGIVERARSFVEENFDWDRAAQKLITRYEQLHEQRIKAGRRA